MDLIALKRLNSMISKILIFNILLIIITIYNFLYNYNKEINIILFIINLFSHMISIFYIQHIKKFNEYYIYTKETGKIFI